VIDQCKNRLGSCDMALLTGITPPQPAPPPGKIFNIYMPRNETTIDLKSATAQSVELACQLMDGRFLPSVSPMSTDDHRCPRRRCCFERTSTSAQLLLWFVENGLDDGFPGMMSPVA
jgi:hypothetical protein